MFEEAATKFANATNLDITERLDQYRLVFDAIDAEPDLVLGQALELLALSSNLPLRDHLELLVDFEGDVVTVTDFSDAQRTKIADCLKAHDQRGNARYDLKIKKNAAGATSIYSLPAFGRYLQHEELFTVLGALDSRFSGGLLFECMFQINPCGSETIRFLPQDQLPSLKHSATPYRPLVLASFRDNSYSADLTTDLIPTDFHLLQRTNEAAVDDFMDKACAVLCAIFIANSSKVRRPDLLGYKLIGYKSIEGEAPFSSFLPALPGLYKIYDWAYGVGGSVDRIGLARNVLSLHVKKLQDVLNQPSIWNAIHSNYQIYLKGNITSYLQVKNKLTDFLVESTAKTHALVDGLVDSLRNGVFALLTFLFTAVVMSGLKGTGPTAIFSANYFWITSILCAVFTVWVLGACRGALRRFDNSTQTTAEIIKIGYGKILLSTEIDESILPISSRNRKYLVRQCWRYSLYWLLITSILVTGFGLGHIYIANQIAPTVSTEEQPERLPIISDKQPAAKAAPTESTIFNAPLDAYPTVPTNSGVKPAEVPTHDHP